MTKLERLQKEAAGLAGQIAIEKTKVKLTCKNKNCGRKTQVGKLTYCQIRCYEEPHGCAGGDYAYNADAFYWDCPKCGYRNRLSAYECDSIEEKTEYNRAWLLKSYFKEIVVIKNY